MAIVPGNSMRHWTQWSGSTGSWLRWQWCSWAWQKTERHCSYCWTSLNQSKGNWQYSKWLWSGQIPTSAAQFNCYRGKEEKLWMLAAELYILVRQAYPHHFAEEVLQDLVLEVFMSTLSPENIVQHHMSLWAPLSLTHNSQDTDKAKRAEVRAEGHCFPHAGCRG